MTASVVSPTLFDDEWFGQLSDREMIVWIGIFGRLRDDQGRFIENAALARARLFPYRDVPVRDVQMAFDRFVGDNRLYRYQTADGKQVLQIVNWWIHQRPQWASPSKLPPPEGWTDRVRYRRNGSYEAVNWDSPGGFTRDDQPNPSAEPLSRTLQVNPSGEPFSYAREPEPEPDKSPSTPSLKVGSRDKTLEPHNQAQTLVENSTSRLAPPPERSKTKEKRHKYHICDEGEPCEVLRLRGVRKLVASIDPTHAGQVEKPGTSLGSALARLAGYICESAQDILPALDREQREQACRRMLQRALERMAIAHTKAPIRSLPRYVNGCVSRDCLGDVIGDDLLEELRREASALYGARSHREEPVSMGAALATIGTRYDPEMVTTREHPEAS